MHDDLERRVLEFVARQACMQIDKLSLSTTLFGDLGVDGDDANDLLEAYAKDFNVDLAGLDFLAALWPRGSRLQFPDCLGARYLRVRQPGATCQFSGHFDQ